MDVKVVILAPAPEEEKANRDAEENNVNRKISQEQLFLQQGKYGVQSDDHENEDHKNQQNRPAGAPSGQARVVRVQPDVGHDGKPIINVHQQYKRQDVKHHPRKRPFARSGRVLQTFLLR